MALSEKQKLILEEVDQRIGKEESFVDKAGFYARAINTGMFSILPPPAQQKLAEWGIINTGEAQGPLEAGFRGIGQALPMAMGGVGALTAKTAAPWLSGLAQQQGAKGIAGGLGQTIAQTAQQAPRAFWAGETAAAFGAGAAGSMVPEEYPTTKAAVEMAAGAAGGALPQLGPRAGRYALETFAPFTEAGGSLRAARQLQERAIDPEAAALAVQQAPRGVTPARATGEEALMATERRILEDAPPSLSNRVNQDLQKAKDLSESELLGTYGEPRTQKDWEKSVMERVAAPGTFIPAGSTSKMLDDAYKSFGPLYNKAKGQSINTKGMASDFVKSVEDPDIIAGDAQRKVIKNWFSSQFNNVVRNKQTEGFIDSGDLIDLRSTVRAKQRDYGKMQTEESRQYREILSNIEDSITLQLESQLAGGPLQSLRTADSQYRQYKIVEDAVFKSGDRGFTPDRMSESIRLASSSRSQYARGTEKVEQELRLLAQAGQRIEDVLGDPAKARALVRDFNASQLRPIKADFVKTAYEKNLKVDDDGNLFLSGRDLKAFLTKNNSTARALGFDSKEVTRLNRIANELVMIERKSPEAVTQLFTDGPATFMQLGAALIGAKSGQRVSGGGLGSSLVLAQFMSRKARDNLARLTSDKATELLTQATTDPKLYSALLVKPTDSSKSKKEAAQIMNAWLLNNIDDEEEATAQPSFSEEQRRILEEVNTNINRARVR